jgi:hypothetical protein
MDRNVSIKRHLEGMFGFDYMAIWLAMDRWMDGLWMVMRVKGRE